MKTGCFEGIKLFLFDMDGTLYIGNRLFDFTEELLASIKRAGKLPAGKTVKSNFVEQA